MRLDITKWVWLVTSLSLAGCTSQSTTENGRASKLASVDDDENGKRPLDCAAIRGGPAMIEVSTPSGERYCVDSTKVTQRQYAEFLAANEGSPGSEDPTCKWNTSYGPNFHDDTTSGGGCYVGPTFDGSHVTESDWFSPETTPNRPVVCVDWCDAFAFCRWSGKRLCGRVGGGAVKTAEFADPKTSQWYNACSNQGATAYPYGDEYEAKECGLGEAPVLADVSAANACHAASGMFAEVYGMSGLTSEWTDACEYSESAGMTLCVAPGGAGSAEVARCDFAGLIAPEAGDSGTGFRCCKD